MPDKKKIASALISVYNKTGLEPIIKTLYQHGVTIYATGGTQDFIRKMNIPVTAVENLTGFPSVLGGRVKTLHPKIFGGILGRRGNQNDLIELEQYEIPPIDLVVVDLYPFSETLASGAPHDDIIEKIDIGGVSLIRAAAKNYNDVTIIADARNYGLLLDEIKESPATSETFRKKMAAHAFAITSHYDTTIWKWLNGEGEMHHFKQSFMNGRTLRYGENPHQSGYFFGNLDDIIVQRSGKELSYNNLLDIDAAVALAGDFTTPVTAILKHNNACGVSTGSDPLQNWKNALASDPVSAFGGIIITTSEVDETIAMEMDKLFFEVLIAPSYSEVAFNLLASKKNRMLLELKGKIPGNRQFRTILNGVLMQDRDVKVETKNDLKTVTKTAPTETQLNDMLVANIIVKHSRSNTIVLVKDQRLIAAGVGQTSRVDALEQAITKAHKFGLFTEGAVMASDAFFPFPDCVSIAYKAGITAVIQPGGSKKDQESIDFCDKNNMAMVLTGTRHFRH